VGVMVAALTTGSGCDGCRAKNAVAKLATLQGLADRNQAGAGDRWNEAEIGTVFEIGDAVRTMAAAKAELDLRSGNERLHMGPETVVRFLDSLPNEDLQRLRVEAGNAMIETGSKGSIRLETLVGTALLSPDSKLHVRFGDASMIGFELILGEATLDQTGSVVNLKAGQNISLTYGKAQLEAAEPPDAGTSDAEPSDAGPTVEPAAPELAEGWDLSQGRVQSEIFGRSVRVRPNAKAKYRVLPRGKIEIPIGSEVIVPAKSSILVRAGQDEAAIQGPSEFTVGVEQNTLRVNLRQGRTVARSGGQGALIITAPGGTIALSGVGGLGSSAAISVSRKRDATVISRTGSTQVTGKKDKAMIEGLESLALTGQGAITSRYPMPTNISLNLAPGESAKIHDPEAPTTVRIGISKQCEDGAAVEFLHPKKSPVTWWGKDFVAMELPTGSNQYVMRCSRDGLWDDQVVARATLVVLKDSGGGQIPKTPSSNSLEADGRRYTIMYQNLLPRITLGWNAAPRAAEYKLSLQPEGSESVETRVSKEATAAFDSGEIDEGVYRWWFESSGPREKSQVSVLTVDFDNAAPAARIRRPGNPVSPSEPTTILGEVTEGATVWVGEKSIPLDAHLRFRHIMIPDADLRSFAIRVAHPKRGNHYYLRHLEKALEGQ
jgi:hypothetical protein